VKEDRKKELQNIQKETIMLASKFFKINSKLSDINEIEDEKRAKDIESRMKGSSVKNQERKQHHFCQQCKANGHCKKCCRILEPKAASSTCPVCKTYGHISADCCMHRTLKHMEKKFEQKLISKFKNDSDEYEPPEDSETYRHYSDL
jgi:hypothetical protein